MDATSGRWDRTPHGSQPWFLIWHQYWLVPGIGLDTDIVEQYSPSQQIHLKYWRTLILLHSDYNIYWPWPVFLSRSSFPFIFSNSLVSYKENILTNDRRSKINFARWYSLVSAILQTSKFRMKKKKYNCLISILNNFLPFVK